MRRSKNTIMLCLAISVLIFTNIALSISVHAQLKFKTGQGVQFTIDPTLSLSVSGDLVIPNLTAGSVADSNEITVVVDTNVISGYYLAATAGTSSTNTDLVNTSNSNYKFTSLAVDASIPYIYDADYNTWGYRFKLGSGSYGSYSGLPLDGDDTGATGARLVDTTDPADSKTVTFQIAAKAAANQPAGTYTNTINFYAVSYPLPRDKTIDDLQYMQDFATLTSLEKTIVLNSMTTDQQYTLIDNRDGKEYYVAKLRDGNVWMTQNLDHNIVTTTDFYTPDNTDIPDVWNASTATYVTGTTTWDVFYTTPESYDPGNYCWSGALGDDTLEDCGTSLGEPNHYHLGNYYNWTAAVATNDSSGYDTDGEIVGQSICPAGWTLPTAGPETGPGSYSNLLTGYGFSDGEMADSRIWGYPLYFSFSGYYWNYYGYGASYDFSGVGEYWSSVAQAEFNFYDSAYEYNMSLAANNHDVYIYISNSEFNDRAMGYSIRCAVR